MYIIFTIVIFLHYTYTYAPVVILFYAQHHALKSTTQKRHYNKVKHSDVRGKGSHKIEASLSKRQGDS